MLGDLQGPKIRVERFKTGKVMLADGGEFALDAARGGAVQVGGGEGAFGRQHLAMGARCGDGDGQESGESAHAGSERVEQRLTSPARRPTARAAGAQSRGAGRASEKLSKPSSPRAMLRTRRKASSTARSGASSLQRESHMTIELREIDFATREVVTIDDRTMPITDLFDLRGRPTSASGRAVVGFAGGPGAWVSFKLAGYDRRALQ